MKLPRFALFLAAVVALARVPTAAQSAPAAPPAVACVAVALPSVIGVDGDASAMSDSLRSMMTTYLSGPTIKSVPLQAKLPEQAVVEARSQTCENVLIFKLTRKHGGAGSKFAKVAGQAAGTAGAYLPYSGVTSAAVGTAAMAGGYAVSSIADSTHAKDELTIEYQLGAPDAVLKAASKKESRKAQSDREDLATPLVEAVASAVVRQVVK